MSKHNRLMDLSLSDLCFLSSSLLIILALGASAFVTPTSEAMDDLGSRTQKGPGGIDFGDAPNAYQTSLSSDGARHNATGPLLGARRDTETDAATPLNGFGDDVMGSGGDDDDGIVFASLGVKIGVMNTVTATISGSAGDTRLYGWIDFNDDGDFSDTGEQIADGIGAFANLSDGPTNIDFTPSAESATGLTYARFRVCTEAGLSFDGLTADGEVEDYRVCLVAHTAGAEGVCQISDQPGGFEDSFLESISGDGERILFQSTANITGQNPDRFFELFLFDTTDGSITQISDFPLGVNGPFDARISGDGSTIVLDQNDDLFNEPTDLVLIDVTTGVSTTIASDPFGTFEAAINHDGSRVVFESELDLTGNNLDGNEEIFLFEVATSTFTQITDTTGFAPSQSPPGISGDGTRIVFTSEHDITGENSDGNAEVFLFDTNTSNFTQVTTSTGGPPFLNIDENGFPVISADGNRIAFRSDRDLTGGNADANFEIFYYDVATGITTQVTNTTGGFDLNGINANDSPSITADGNIIAFDSNRDLTGSNPDSDNEIFTFNVLGGTFTQITNAASQPPFSFESYRPLIISDGSQIAFDSSANQAGSNTDGNVEVFLYDTTNGVTQITDTKNRSSTSPTMNLNGTLIAFSSVGDLVGKNADGTPEIFLLDTTRSDLVQITNSTTELGFSGGPDISSDGQHLVFVSTSDLTGNNSDRNAEIFTLDRATMSYAQITDTVGGFDFLPIGRSFSLGFARFQYSPFISQDGSQLAFMLNQDLTGNNADENFEAFLFDVSTSGFTQVTNTMDAGGFASNQGFAASSDISTLALVSTSDFTGENADGSKELFLFDVGTSNFRQITNSPSMEFVEIFGPALDGDGTVVAFESNGDFTGQNPDGGNELFIFDTEIDAFTQITNESTLFFFQGASIGAVSDDGTRIAYVSREDPNGFNADNSSELFLFDTNTGLTTQVTSTVGFSDFDDLTVIDPVISGNGEVVVFEGEEVDYTCDNVDLSLEVFAVDVSSIDSSAAPIDARTCMDFGDAPQGVMVGGVLRQYPTSLPDGARHRFDVNSPFLGEMLPDAEIDGRQDSSALGDDNDVQGDDENVDGAGGLTFVRGQSLAGFSLTHRAANDGAFLNVWVDLNINGSWDDPGEHVLADGPVAPGIGSTPLDSITIPDATATGTTFVRVRISTEPGLMLRGEAPDGEVEDFLATIKRVVCPQPYPDFNMDGRVDSADLSQLIQGIENGDAAFDLTEDNMATEEDLIEFNLSWYAEDCAP